MIGWRLSLLRFQAKKDMVYAFFSVGNVIILMLPFWFLSEHLLRFFVYPISLLMIGFILWTWFGTIYIVNDGLLKVISGPIRKKINIQQIKMIQPIKGSWATISPYAGPALSRSQLEITYGKHGDVLSISPKNPKLFIKQLQAKNKLIKQDRQLKGKTNLK